ncbi:hypothetical protein U6V44_11235 [Cutibacterium acnes]
MASPNKKNRPGGYPVWLWVVIGLIAVGSLASLGERPRRGRLRAADRGSVCCGAGHPSLQDDQVFRQ